MWGWLRPLLSFLQRVFQVAQDNGLTAEIQQQALELVTTAAGQFGNNTQRREWAVATLVAAHVPESIARLAVELAVQLYKSRTA